MAMDNLSIATISIIAGILGVMILLWLVNYLLFRNWVPRRQQQWPSEYGHSHMASVNTYHPNVANIV
jgi:hypothetical protein